LPLQTTLALSLDVDRAASEHECRSRAVARIHLAVVNDPAGSLIPNLEPHFVGQFLAIDFSVNSAQQKAITSGAIERFRCRSAVTSIR